MLLLSSFLFATGVEVLSPPVPVTIQLPVTASSQSSSASSSASPARDATALKTYEYNARLKQFANKTDGLSLVSVKNKNEEAEAKRLLDVLKTFPLRSAQAQDLKKYEPTEVSHANIADEFDIIASDSTGATLDGRYRVKKRDAEEYYNLVVCNVKNVTIRNAFMAELLKAYRGRKETFKDFLAQQASGDPSTVVASDSVSPPRSLHDGKAADSSHRTPSGAVGQEQQRALKASSPSTSEALSVAAILKEIKEAPTFVALQAIVQKANLPTEPQLDSVRKEIAELEVLASKIKAAKVQTELVGIDQKITERQRKLLVSEMQAAAARFAPATRGADRPTTGKCCVV